MSRMTSRRRSAHSLPAPVVEERLVHDWPVTPKKHRLICSACGKAAEYHLGTVTIDPTRADPSDHDFADRAIGFTGYFRCVNCHAGGPWEIPTETLAYITALMLAATDGQDDVPLVLGGAATFDRQTFRYATECEDHLLHLIEAEPTRSFLRLRLGNLYSHAGLHAQAEAAYRKAIELDPQNLEAHGMLGQFLVEMGRGLEGVPHWHAVLRHVRDAQGLTLQLKRELVRAAIENLLEAHAESKGSIDLLPKLTPDEVERRLENTSRVVRLREFDLGSERGINQLCDCFVNPPRQRWRDMFSRKPRVAVPVDTGDALTPIRTSAPHLGRNDLCLCGSGKKYKKCCGRGPT